MTEEEQRAQRRIAVVIPCFRVGERIDGVLAALGPEVWRAYVVDDCCPDRTGDRIAGSCRDPRVVVVRHEVNQGVGGAVVTGYRRALEDGAEVVVKLDGDGQMDPALIPRLVAPLLAGTADYVKGNRFLRLDAITAMPLVRRLGNGALSLACKFSTGYWQVLDPTNGFTAIEARVLRELPLDKLSRRYFFETDMLFRLNVARAVVHDMPMAARYAGESSGIRLWRVTPEFLLKNARIACKRILYRYFYVEFNAGTIELLGGLAAMLFGLVLGTVVWIENARAGVLTPTGTIMLAALPTMLGFQLLLSFLHYDIASVPREPLQRSL
jgi:glycosyltransferase involved in cell wall biosynthesis